MSGFRAAGRLRRDPLGFLRSLAGEPPLARCTVGRRQLVLAVTPAAAKETLVTRRRELVKEQVVDAGRYRGAPAKPGFLTSNQTANHEQGRQLLRPSFGREQTSRHVQPYVLAEAERLCETWSQNAVVDVERELTKATMQIAARTLFGVDLGDPVEAEADLRTVLGEFHLVVSPYLKARGLLDVRGGLRFVRAAERFDAIGTQLLNGPGPVAVALRESPLEPPLAAIEARNIVLAGSETTAVVLTWALRELARQPALAAAVAAEGEPFAEQVFNEAMRLYPPAWFIGRLAVTATELAGERIDEGTMVLVSPYLLHRDERHFERAEVFDPARWRDGTSAAARSFTFVPFGAGPRRCIGEEIALTEGRVILTALARSLVFEPADHLDVQPFPGASLRPAQPVLLRARARDSARRNGASP